MRYIYPAIFTSNEDKQIIVTFPDLPEVETYGQSLADAYYMAEDALGLWLWEAEESGDTIPQASDIQDINIEEGTVSYIGADTKEYKLKHDTQLIKKTLTIPRWLNTEAERKGINFSQLLQQALKAEITK